MIRKTCCVIFEADFDYVTRITNTHHVTRAERESCSVPNAGTKTKTEPNSATSAATNSKLCALRVQPPMRLAVSSVTNAERRSREQSKVQGPESKVKKVQHPSPPPAPNFLHSYTSGRTHSAEQAAMEARGAADGERKTITALFADIKGSTALIENLDPEDAQRIVDPALQVMMDAVHRYEGYVAQSLGDGIFALFGAPIAHEDHAHRALYAALLMQEENKKQAEKLRLEQGINVQIRVGINTGEVVVRSIRKDDLHTDYVPVGHSTNIASRMESLATPGTIVISEHTHKLTDGYFEFKSLGGAQVKGVTDPLKIYEVLGVGPLRTKLQVAARRGLARFIGRQREVDDLTNRRWHRHGPGMDRLSA